MQLLLFALLLLTGSLTLTAQSLIDRCSLDHDDTRDSIRTKLLKCGVRATELDDGFTLSGKFVFADVTMTKADISLGYPYEGKRVFSGIVYWKKRGTITIDLQEMDSICTLLGSSGHTQNVDALTTETFPCSYTRSIGNGFEIQYDVILNKAKKRLMLLESMTVSEYISPLEGQ